MTEKQFIETYCNGCGTQRCEGIGSPWFEGCPKRWNLDGYGDAATEIERLNDKIMELGFKLVKLSNVSGEWKVEEHNEHLNVVCSNCNKDFYVYKKGQYRLDNSNYCPNCGAEMKRKDCE